MLLLYRHYKKKLREAQETYAELVARHSHVSAHNRMHDGTRNNMRANGVQVDLCCNRANQRACHCLHRR